MTQDDPWQHGTPADGSALGGQEGPVDGELYPNHGRHTVASEDDSAELDDELPRFRPRSTAVDAGPVLEPEARIPGYRVRDYSPEGRRAGPIWAPSYVRAEPDPDLPSESFSRTGPVFARRSFVSPEEDSLAVLPDRRVRDPHFGGHRRPQLDRSQVNPDTESHEEVVASQEARFQASNAVTAAVPTVSEAEQYRELAPEPTGFAPEEPQRFGATAVRNDVVDSVSLGSEPAAAQRPVTAEAAPASFADWGVELPAWAAPFEFSPADAAAPAEAAAIEPPMPTEHEQTGGMAALDAEGLPTWNEAEGRPMRRRELRALREAMDAAAHGAQPGDAPATQEAPHAEAPHAEAPQLEAPHAEVPHAEAPRIEAASAETAHEALEPWRVDSPQPAAPWPSWAVVDSGSVPRADAVPNELSPAPTVGPGGDLEYPPLPAEVEYTVGGTRWEIPRSPATPAEHPADGVVEHEPLTTGSAPFALQEPPEDRPVRSSADVAAEVATREHPWVIDVPAEPTSLVRAPAEPVGLLEAPAEQERPVEPTLVPLVDGSVDLVPVEPAASVESLRGFTEAPEETKSPARAWPVIPPRVASPLSSPSTPTPPAEEEAPSWTPPVLPAVSVPVVAPVPTAASDVEPETPSVPPWLPPTAAAIVALDPVAESQLGDQPGIESPGVAASREVHGGSSAITTSALVLDQAPSLELTGPINTITGEILVTGSVLLPSSLAETGAHPMLLDESALDHELDPGDYQLASTQSQPIRAVQALATGLSQSMVAPARRGGNRGLTALIAISGVLVVLVGGLLVYGLATNAFHL